MRNRKHGLKAFALSIMAALSVMAFSVAGAQAQAPELPGKSTTGSFSVEGGLPTGQALAGKQLNAGYLLVKARDLKIECQKGKLETGSKVTSSTHAEAIVVFELCVAQNHLGVPLKDCLFKELETVKATALALPVVHGGKRFVLFEPLNLGPEFANVRIKPETTCTLPLNNPVAGSVVAEVTSGLEGELLGLVFNETNQLLSGDVLKYGNLQNTAYVNATADVEIVGGKKNLGVH